MDYKNKSDKYYHKLKSNIDQPHKYFSLITDKIIYDNCEEPNFIRVLQHPISKKLIILLGESHVESDYRFTIKKFNYEHEFDRINTEKGIDYILGQISKRISNAKDNLSDPFHKVLLLSEMQPTNILLGGQSNNILLGGIEKKIKNELSPDLLEIKGTFGSLQYISSKFNRIFSKYKNVIYRAIDLRSTLDIDYCMVVTIDQIIYKYKMDKDTNLSMKDLFININDLFINSMNNINKYIINDEQFMNMKPPVPPPYGDEENKKFFGDSYTRKPQIFPRKLSEIFIHTQHLYSILRELFIETVNEYNKNPNILTNPSFDYLSDDDRIELFMKNINGLNILITRIMDLYILEYIHLMDNNTATVVYTGSAHSRFLFNELIVLEKYKILEMENTNYIYNSDERNICERVFPSFNTNLDKLNSNYDNIKNMYDNVEIDAYKKNFIKNMLLMTINPNVPVMTNIELQLGFWENTMAVNPSELFLIDRPYY